MFTIKKYEPLWGVWYVESLLGEGSFAQVYKVRRQEFGNTYYAAVKMISIPRHKAEIHQMRREGLDEASIRNSLQTLVNDLLTEIDMMSQFRGNSHIVNIADHQIIERTGEPGWDILLRMELLESLSHYTAHTPLTQGEVVRLGIHICRALELCAQRHTIHRDIKPDNIFVSAYGGYKLGDFGIARHIEGTMSGLSRKGTYNYMAPEVFYGEKYGASVDTYSLGIVMYRFLNYNRVPFLPDYPQPLVIEDRENALKKRMNGIPVPNLRGVTPELNAIVLRACAFRPEERFGSPAEMRGALEEAARHIQEAVHTTQNTTPNMVPNPALMHEPPFKEGTPMQAEFPQQSVNTGNNPADAWNNPANAWNNPANAEDNATQLLTPALQLPPIPPIPKVAQTDGWATPSYPAGTQPPAPSPSKNKILRKALLTSAIALAAAAVVALGAWGVFSLLRSDPQASVPTETDTEETVRPYYVKLAREGITDEELAAMVEDGRIPPEVTDLDLTYNQISDITPLQSLTQLTTLQLFDNQIIDITPLQFLTKLTYLDLSRNKVSDVTPLQPLTLLKNLWLGSNQINDITSLQFLTELEELELFYNSISDVTSLQPLSKLKMVLLSGNQISDITALQSLTELTSLSLDANQIKDITPLQTLPALKTLRIGSNQISDVSALQSLQSLTELRLGGNQIQDIAPLQGLTNLEKLSLENTMVSDISVLVLLPKLNNLNFGGNPAGDLTPLQSMTGLHTLVLYNMQLRDTRFLESLTQLKELHLSNNQISDITPLRSLSNLQNLTMSNNQISNITSLGSLTNLQSLTMSNNQISDITSLKSLTKLKFLDLYNNRISSITPLEPLTELTNLFLAQNPFTDAMPLKSLTNLVYLTLGSGVPPGQISELGAALPKCDISAY